MAAVVLPQCQVIGGFARYEVGTLSEGGAGGAGGAGGVGGEGGDAICILERPPEGPVDTAQGDLDFTLAVRTVDLGEMLLEPLGLDVDGACTCGPEDCPCAAAATCSKPGIVDAGKWLMCDDVRGIDGNSAQLYNTFSTFGVFLSSGPLSLAIQGGEGTLLIEVNGYNGEPDDERVFVGVYTTGRYADAVCSDGVPAWDGEDHWPVAKASTQSSINNTCGEDLIAGFFDDKAYVVDGKLVAELPEVRFRLQLGAAMLQLKLVDVKAVAPLHQDDLGRWVVTDATLSGRWPVKEVFRALAALDALPNVQLCEGDLTSTQGSVCEAADLRASGTPDEGPCDAVSFGATFSAYEAKLGNVIELPEEVACPALENLDCETAIP